MKFRLLITLIFPLTLCAQQSADSLIREGNYEAALEWIDRRGGNDDDQLMRSKTSVLISLGRYAQAASLISLLMERVADHVSDRADAVALRGFLHMNTGRNDLALADLMAALDLYTAAGRAAGIDAARCHSNLGTLYYNTGKYQQAEDQYVLSLDIRRHQFGENHPEVAAALNDLGLVHGQSDPDEALAFYEKALRLYSAAYGEDHPKIAIVHSNMGIMYKKLELYGDAINNFESALAIWKRVYPGGHPNQALVLSYLGQTYALLNNRQAASGFFRQAISQYRTAYGDHHPDIAATCNQLAIFQSSIRQYDSALYFLNQALKANSSRFSGTDRSANPSSDDHYNPYVLLYSLQLKAGVLEMRHYGKTLRLTDLKQAVDALMVCDTLISAIRRQSSEETDKITLGTIAHEVFEDGVRIAQAISDMTLHPAPWRERAMYFAEKSKAAVLLEAIADASAKSFAGLPDSLLDRERGLRAELALKTRQLAEAAGGPGETSLRLQLVSLKADQEKFTNRLRQEFPRYFDLKYQASLPSVKELQAMLGPEVAVVSYFIADKNSSLYIFNVTRKNFSVSVRRIPAGLDRTIKGYYNSLLYDQPRIYQETAPALAALLDPRAGRGIKKLYLIPAGPLGTLPFEALPLDKRSVGEEFSSGYWVDRYSIGYEFSTALMAGNARRNDAASDKILFCAPVTFGQDRQLMELPGTRSEVNRIASLFNGSSEMMMDQEATESGLRAKDLHQYRYLHLATHGIADESSPELSRIYLGRTPQDDGDLFSGEIYNLSLQADVVTLSACQTGLGKVSKGEGVIGLSRALRYAGAREVVVSFWSVSDTSTANLMVDFYQSFRSTETPDYQEALAMAKRRMIRSSEFRSPFHWAPFVVIGY